MAQITAKFELATADFPLFSDLAGRTILAEEQRQTAVATTPSTLPQIMQKPQIIYAENVIPTATGYKSIGFNTQYFALRGRRVLSDVFQTLDSLKQPAILGACTDGTLWLYDEQIPRWLGVTKPAGWNGGKLSFALVSGLSLVFLPGAGLYELNGTTKQLVKKTVTGIVDTSALGICGVFGYLIFYDSSTIYYSSATNPLDFVPSLSTGAGSGKVQEALGVIRFLRQTSLGFFIFCENNIVSAQYSQNIRYPWIFKAVDNSTGVDDISHVTDEDDTGSHYALSVFGLLSFNVKSARAIFPAVTDFLAAGRLESYDKITHVSTFTPVVGGLRKRINFINRRWLIISYGIVECTQALLYDSALRRWGKIVTDHAAFVALNLDYSSVFLKCSDLLVAASSYFTACNAMYSAEIAQFRNDPVLTCFSPDGKLKIATLEHLSVDDAIVILGKFQLTRGKKCQIQELELECVGEDNIAATLLSSSNGKTIDSITPMYKLEAADGFVHFLGSEAPEAENHLVELRGAFNIVGQQITVTQGGRS